MVVLNVHTAETLLIYCILFHFLCAGNILIADIHEQRFAQQFLKNAKSSLAELFVMC